MATHKVQVAILNQWTSDLFRSITADDDAEEHRHAKFIGEAAVNAESFDAAVAALPKLDRNTARADSARNRRAKPNVPLTAHAAAS